MRTDIQKTEMRKNYDGTPVLDVIYNDGTKSKLNKAKLEKQRSVLTGKAVSTEAELNTIDESLAMVEAETVKSKKS